MDMSENGNYACPFVANGFICCSTEILVLMKLQQYLFGHPKAAILYREALGVFSRPIVKFYVENKEWPSLGAF
jgi:hypothetical protein